MPRSTLFMARLARAKFPHPLVLLLGGVLLAALLTWILPAGEYARQLDPVTHREIVVAGTYHAIAAQPVGAFGALVAIPQGLIAAADVVFFVFLIGGAFAVVERTGALARGMDGLVRVLAGRQFLVIPIVSIAFGIGGALEHMQEEIIALVPALLLLTRRFGYDPLVAVAMSIGAAAVGAAFSPLDPFQVGIAQQLAHLPLLSGAGFRTLFLVIAMILWIWATMRFAARTRGAAEQSPVNATAQTDGRYSTLVLLIVVASFAVFVYGVFKLGWDFTQMAALFFLMGIVAGIVGGLRVTGTAEAFVDGFRGMAYAAIVIGFARAISTVLEQGKVVDTIIHGLFTPLGHLPVLASAASMLVMHTAIHFPVPSVSGQAVLTIPVLAPLADLLGMPRQVMILTYQYGAGLCELLTPTNGALIAILTAAGVSYERWIRVVFPALLGLFALAMVAITAGLAIHLS